MLFAFYDVRTFQELLRKCVFGFKCRLADSDNPLVQTVFCNVAATSRLMKRWNEVLY